MIDKLKKAMAENPELPVKFLGPISELSPDEHMELGISKVEISEWYVREEKIYMDVSELADDMANDAFEQDCPESFPGEDVIFKQAEELMESVIVVWMGV